jgi:hypothetical protein
MPQLTSMLWLGDAATPLWGDSSGSLVRGGVASDVRRCDDDLRIHEVLIERRVLTLLVRSGDELVALLFDPLPYTELILSRTEELRLLSGVLAALTMTLAIG